jgi:hypothetical protein
MRSARVQRGSVVNSEHPDWRPLLGLVREEVAGEFMWMFEVELDDGSRVQAYKHVDTRRYVHLGAEGGAFRFEAPRSYRPAPALDEVRAALASRGW